MTEASRKSRIKARTSPEALKVVRRAAEIPGRSVSDFVVAAAERAAQQAISDIEALRLSREAEEQSIDLLLSPPQPNSALIRAFKRHRSLVESK